MNSRQLPHSSTPDTNVLIVPVAAEEQKRKIDAAVAQRAYEIFQKRGGMGWHELEDWRQAEAEVRSKVCVGITTQDHAVFIGTDAAGFEPSTLEVWVAPRQLTICGKTRLHGPQAIGTGAHPARHMAFRQIQLPFAVDYTGTRTNFHGRFLEIQLPQAMPQKQTQNSSAA